MDASKGLSLGRSSLIVDLPNIVASTYVPSGRFYPRHKRTVIQIQVKNKNLDFWKKLRMFKEDFGTLERYLFSSNERIKKRFFQAVGDAKFTPKLQKNNVYFYTGLNERQYPLFTRLLDELEIDFSK